MTNEKKYETIFGKKLPVIQIKWIGGAREMIDASDAVSGEFYGYAVSPEDYGTTVYRVAESQAGDIADRVDVQRIRKLKPVNAEWARDEIDL